MQQMNLNESYKLSEEESQKLKKEIYRDMLREGNVAIACLFLIYRFVAFRQNPDNILPRGADPKDPRYKGKEKMQAAWMDESTNSLWMNADIPPGYQAIIARHEVLHFFLEHETRAIKQIAYELGMDPDTISAQDILNIKNSLHRSKHFRELVNLPADNEIAVTSYEDDEEKMMKDVKYTDEIDAHGNLIPDEDASDAMFLYHQLFIPILSDCEELKPLLGMPYERMVHEMYKKYYGTPKFKVIDGTMNTTETCFKDNNGNIYGKQDEVDL